MSVPANQQALYSLVDLLCECVDVGVSLKAEGGKIGFADLMKFGTVIPLIAPAFSDIGDVLGQIEGLQTADEEALVAHIASELSIITPHAADVLKSGLAFLSSGYALFQAIKAPGVTAAAVAAAAPVTPSATPSV